MTASSFLLLLSLSLVSATPYCNYKFYGFPDVLACNLLLRGPQGIKMLDRQSHVFKASSLWRKPQDVTGAQWRNGEDLPMDWNEGAGDCNAVLLPSFNSIGAPSYDTAQYSLIASTGQSIIYECLNSLGSRQTLAGGREVTGDNDRLIFILFETKSPFDKLVQAHVKAGRLFDYTGHLIDTTTAPSLNHNPYTDTSVAGSSSYTQPQPGTSQTGLTCGMHCSGPSALCMGDDGCKCIADPWQGVGSRFFTGSCKLPYIKYDSGRELNEVDLNAPGSSNTTLIQAAGVANSMNLACPCNCTYVSHACCSSGTGIVYEAPRLKLGSLQPPSANLSCNTTTGVFQAVSTMNF